MDPSDFKTAYHADMRPTDEIRTGPPPDEAKREAAPADTRVEVYRWYDSEGEPRHPRGGPATVRCRWRVDTVRMTVRWPSVDRPEGAPNLIELSDEPMECPSYQSVQWVCGPNTLRARPHGPAKIIYLVPEDEDHTDPCGERLAEAWVQRDDGQWSRSGGPTWIRWTRGSCPGERRRMETHYRWYRHDDEAEENFLDPWETYRRVRQDPTVEAERLCRHLMTGQLPRTWCDDLTLGRGKRLTWLEPLGTVTTVRDYACMLRNQWLSDDGH